MAPKSKKMFNGFSTDSLLRQRLQSERKEGQRLARVHVSLTKKAKSAVRIVESEDKVQIFLSPLSVPELERDARLKSSNFTKIRDAVGASVSVLEKMEVGWADFQFELDPEALDSALLGLELALYRFKRLFNNEPIKLGISLQNRGKAVSEASLAKAATLGVAVNLARHLVNLPPNLLNPVTYAEGAQTLLRGLKNLSVEVWDEKRLEKEKMGLLLAVGRGSSTPPRLVHIRYRPPGSGKKAPVALVGKGVTFDSGGLDIKPSSGMRLMKKDMGGSAAVLAVAFWAANAGAKTPLDVYLSLAENGVDGNSFRPSDIIFARNGSSVEIHNTDAEGRLVLADAMDVAITAKEKPRVLLDVATLTGAIKTALGASIAGLFSTDAKLASDLVSAGQRAGELLWAMPLFQKYRGQLNSIFADQANSSDGFGGAITAALFLEKFAGDVPWAHLDIYAWKDGGEGAWLEAGASGQPVMALVSWLRAQK